VLAGGAIFVGLRRWRRRDDEPRPHETLDPDDAERLDSDLARYEL
jgi:hypothetical protein